MTDKDDWRTMSSAPMDGRVILGYWNPEYIETIAYRNGEWIWTRDGDSWIKDGPIFWAPFNPPQQAKEQNA